MTVVNICSRKQALTARLFPMTAGTFWLCMPFLSVSTCSRQGVCLPTLFIWCCAHDVSHRVSTPCFYSEWMKSASQFVVNIPTFCHARICASHTWWTVSGVGVARCIITLTPWNFRFVLVPEDRSQAAVGASWFSAVRRAIACDVLMKALLVRGVE